MKNIVTLGPKNTFSDIATRIYCSSQNHQLNILYEKSIKDVLHKLNEKEIELAVLPIENLSEGYIPVIFESA